MFVEPTVALADPLAKVVTQNLPGEAGLSFDAWSDRVVAEDAVDGVVLCRDLSDSIETVPIEVGQSYVYIKTLQLKSWLAAKLVVVDEQHSAADALTQNLSQAFKGQPHRWALAPMIQSLFKGRIFHLKMIDQA